MTAIEKSFRSHTKKYLKHSARPKSFEGLRFSPLATKDGVDPKINCRPDPKLRSPDARNTTVGESSKRYRGLRDPVSCLILFVMSTVDLGVDSSDQIVSGRRVRI